MKMAANAQLINNETMKGKQIERLRPSVSDKPKPPLARKPIVGAFKQASLASNTGRIEEDASPEQALPATNVQSFSQTKGPPPPLPKDPPQGPICQMLLPPMSPNPLVTKVKPPPPLPKSASRNPRGVKISSTDLHSPISSPEVLASADKEMFESTLHLQSDFVDQSGQKNVFLIEENKTKGKHSDLYNLTNEKSTDSKGVDQKSSESQIQLSLLKEPVFHCRPSQQKPVPRRPAPKTPLKTGMGKISQSSINQELVNFEYVNEPSGNGSSIKDGCKDEVLCRDKLLPAISNQIGSQNAKEKSNSDCQDENIVPTPLALVKTESAENHLVEESFVTVRIKLKQNSVSSTKVVAEAHATPTHSNSQPIEKPRPVPRKRLSLSRQSATLDGTRSLHKISSNLSLTDSSDLDVKNIQETGGSFSTNKASGETAGREHAKENTRSDISKHQMILNDTDTNVPKSAVWTVKDSDTYTPINDDNNKVDCNDNNKTDENDNKKIDSHNLNYKAITERGGAIQQGDNGNSDERDIKKSSSLKGSFENILGEHLDTSSLLNEMNAVLSQGYEQMILLNTDNSEKLSSYNNLHKNHKGQPLMLDSGSSNAVTDDIPVKPPRTRKEQFRQKLQNNVHPRHLADLEMVSHSEYTQSLDRVKLCQSHDSYFISEREDGTRTLGPARKHPPKPERKKLLSIQRSQSDLSQHKLMDRRVFNIQRSNSSATETQNPLNNEMSDCVIRPSVPGMKESESGSKPDLSGSKPDLSGSKPDLSGSKPDLHRITRPTRKAPLPPNVIQNIGSLNLGSVPLLHTGKCADINNTEKDPSLVSVYHSIDDVDKKGFSKAHDYHEIPDDLDENEVLKPMKFMTSQNNSPSSRPILSPRNCTAQYNSNVFPLIHDIDNISIVSDGSNSEDVSNGYPETEVSVKIGSSLESPDLSKKRELCDKPAKSGITCSTSQTKALDCDSLKVSDDSLALSNSSDGCDEVEIRPDSRSSLTKNNSDSGGHESLLPDDMLSSSESEVEAEESKVMRKKEMKLYLIAQEIVSSERVFVDVLKLLNLDFRVFVSKAAEHYGRPVIPAENLNRILDYLPQLQNFNEDLLKDLEERLSKWESQKRISDIFVKKGPFLKLYSSYIRDFENMTTTLDDAIRRYPHFQEVVKEFEMSPRCANLKIKHYMLKPIQRIPQYRLLLQDYMKHLPPKFPDLKDTQTALNIVSEVAEHANESMRHGDHAQKLLEIQRSLIGQFEVIKPGRDFIKDGELKKLSRKEMQPRKFFLFNDVLLYTTPIATGFRLNNILPLTGMKVTVPSQDEFKTEFSIISVQRSFTVAANSPQERENWISALNSAINDNLEKRSTFDSIRSGPQDPESILDKDFILGHKAPPWIPDSRVTMCMLCTCNFSITWRRHHCRACGKVVCGNCSDKKFRLRYLKFRAERVCSACFVSLSTAPKQADVKGSTLSEEEPKEIDESSPDGTNFRIGDLLERFSNIRHSGRFRPAVLKEVHANDQGAMMSGYLKQFKKGKKWKRFWFVLKDKVLYTFKASEDMAAITSMVLLGYEVTRFSEYYEGVEPGLVFKCTHRNQPPVVFCTDSSAATEKWVTVMREASVA